MWKLNENPWILVDFGLNLVKITFSFHVQSEDFSKIHIFPFKSMDLKLNPLI